MMTDARILQLAAEILAADPSLRHREGEVRELIASLFGLSGYAQIDSQFRDGLLRRLRARMALTPTTPGRAWWHMPRLAWSLGVVAVLVLMVATNRSGPIESPAPVAFDTELQEESTVTSGAPSEAPMLMAVRSKDAGTMLTMQLTSIAFDSDARIPALYTCDGGETRPPFAFTGIPEGTQSFAMIVDDPDAPSGTWTHWVAYNIPQTVDNLSSDKLPDDVVQGTTSFGATEWRGPCPPSGTHRYVFTLYALDTVFPSDATMTADRLREMMTGHILSEAALVGTYR